MTNGTTIHQIEEGNFSRIPNAILEALAKARLSGSESRCIYFLIRKTYGWGKKEDRISLSQWAEGTDTKRPHVLKTLNMLIEKKIIYRRLEDGQVPYYGLNKYIEEWEGIGVDSQRGERFKKEKVLPEQVTVTRAGNSTVTRAGNKTVTYTGTHKRKKEIKRKGDAAEKTAVRNAMFSLVARVCRMDMNLKRGHINTVVKRLMEAGYVPEDLEFFAGWWEKNDFRGRRGDPPTTKQLEDRIYEAKQVRLKQAEKAIKSEDTLFYVDVGTERQWWQGGELIRTEPIGANV